MKQAKHGNAYQAVRFLYDHSPGRSWQRLNGALHNVLVGSITAHLTFLEDDFSAMLHDMAGGYWMGNSEGSTTGERYYILAVRVGHTPACLAFEKYAGRPPALWCEDVKTPERLCIGSDFTWNGVKVTVTNMMQDRFVACSYKWADSDAVYVKGHYRKLVSMDNEEMPVKIRLGEVLDQNDQRKVVKRFTITYEELKAKRQELDKAAKAALKEIQQCDTVDALRALSSRMGAKASEYRAFDLRAFREAYEERKKALSQKAVA